MEKTFKEIKNGDHTYQVYPLTGRAACHLDRKVCDLAYSFRGDASSASELGMLVLHAFANMGDYQFDEIVEQSIPNVVRIGVDGELNTRLTIDNIYDFFSGDIDGLYGFLVSLWECYGLTPFKQARAQNTGNSTTTTA